MVCPLIPTTNHLFIYFFQLIFPPEGPLARAYSLVLIFLCGGPKRRKKPVIFGMWSLGLHYNRAPVFNLLWHRIIKSLRLRIWCSILWQGRYPAPKGESRNEEVRRLNEIKLTVSVLSWLDHPSTSCQRWIQVLSLLILADSLHWLPRIPFNPYSLHGQDSCASLQGFPEYILGSYTMAGKVNRILFSRDYHRTVTSLDSFHL